MIDIKPVDYRIIERMKGTKIKFIPKLRYKLQVAENEANKIILKLMKGAK